MIALQLFCLATVLATVQSARLKVANTVGGDTLIDFDCYNSEKKEAHKCFGTLSNKGECNFSITDNKDCNHVGWQCQAKNKKGQQVAAWPICFGCGCGDNGYFLRCGKDPGVYKGTLTGKNIKKYGDLRCNLL